MKKIAALIVMLVVCFSISGCGDKVIIDNNNTSLPTLTDSKEYDEVTVTPVDTTETDISDEDEISASENIKPLEESDFEVVQGENIIKLDSPYAEFKFDKPEEQLDNNYVGETYSGEFIYKTYFHLFEDFELYVSNANYNIKNRNFDEYYITQIVLKNSNFATGRGIAIGSDAVDIENKYGSAEKSTIDGKINLTYRLGDKEISFIIGDNQKVESIVLNIIVEGVQ